MKKIKLLGFILTILVLLLVIYLSGVYAGHKRIFPTREIFYIKNRIISNSSLLSDTFLLRYVARPKARNTIYEAFSPPSDIVMIGDSMVENGPWSEIFPSVKIANRGIGGDSTIDILQRMGPIFAVKPKKAFILVGLNDFAYGADVDQAYANYLEIVKQLQHRGIQVLIQSTIECSRRTCGIQVQKVRDLNHKLQTFAKNQGIVYIDLNQYLTSEKEGLLSKYTVDGAHLLGGGYIKWRNAIAPYVLDRTNDNR